MTDEQLAFLAPKIEKLTGIASMVLRGTYYLHSSSSHLFPHVHYRRESH